MAEVVCSGAMMQCSMGLAPATLEVLPIVFVATQTPIATVSDCEPMVNIPPFGMCNSMANPEVASATAAAQGVLTPMPCVPVPVGPWQPGQPEIMVGNIPTVDKDCTLNCAWGGVITITTPG